MEGGEAAINEPTNLYDAVHVASIAEVSQAGKPRAGTPADGTKALEPGIPIDNNAATAACAAVRAAVVDAVIIGIRFCRPVDEGRRGFR